MRVLSLLALGLAPFSGAFAQIIDTGNPDIQAEIVEVDEDYVSQGEADASHLQSANFKINIKTSFPNAESMFGTKLVNGRPTQALLSIDNGDTQNVMLRFVGGSLWTPDSGTMQPHLVSNLSTVQYNTEILAGSGESLTYSFTQDLHPQDLQLRLAAIFSDSTGQFFTLNAFNETVSVVEAPISFFDPST